MYLYLTPVISRVFFGGARDSVIATLGVFAVSYVMRPVGAAVFGHFGDRIGRRNVLLISMSIMTARGSARIRARHLRGFRPALRPELGPALRPGLGTSLTGCGMYQDRGTRLCKVYAANSPRLSEEGGLSIERQRRQPH